VNFITRLADDNREVVFSAGGCHALMEQLDKCSDPSCEAFSNTRFKCVVCGCLQNVAAENGESALIDVLGLMESIWVFLLCK
jgi:hypothetical protein